MTENFKNTVVRIDRAACTIEMRSENGQAASIGLAFVEGIMTTDSFTHVFCHSGAQYYLPVSAYELVHSAWVEYSKGNLDEPEVRPTFNVADQEYAMEDFYDLRAEVIKLRDHELAEGRFGNATKLSHMIAISFQMAARVWGHDWQEFMEK